MNIYHCGNKTEHGTINKWTTSIVKTANIQTFIIVLRSSNEFKILKCPAVPCSLTIGLVVQISKEVAFINITLKELFYLSVERNWCASHIKHALFCLYWLEKKCRLRQSEIVKEHSSLNGPTEKWMRMMRKIHKNIIFKKVGCNVLFWQLDPMAINTKQVKR